jgi:hypothetical protein
MVRAFLATTLASMAAADMALTWNDCGDETYHAKISKVTPDSLKTGTQVTISGFGDLDQDIDEGVSFTMAMEGQFTDCKGLASKGKKCNFPLDMGSIEFLGLAPPYKAGEVPIAVDVKISKALPATLLETTTQVTGIGATSGDMIFCMNVYTKKAASNSGASLDVDWSDCGASQGAKSKITGLTPSQLVQGSVNHIVGTGLLREDLEEEINFESSMRIAFLNCNGDGVRGKKCTFPLDLGSVEFKGIPTPIKQGQQEIDVDLKMSKLIPDGTKSTTHVTATSASGKNLFCLNVNTDGKQQDAVEV